MPTDLEQAQGKPTMCLKHGDFHVMRGECWRVTLEWYFEQQQRDPSESFEDRRQRYWAAWECELLDRLTEEHRKTRRTNILPD